MKIGYGSKNGYINPILNDIDRKESEGIVDGNNYTEP